MILFLMNLFFSIVFILLTHPLSMGLILLIQTLIISLITGNFSLNYWFSYILFLILVGSMLILFIYMTSIASNEKFNFKINNLMLLSLIFMFIMLLIPIISPDINNINSDQITLSKNTILSTSMIKYLNFPSNLILVFLIIYLLLTLIAVVKITDFKYGPLRLKN
uniref:NADH-ubiquinone oxidoreductase chain 6 n=1 Tax=Anaspis sp. BMNH 840206 TaxID=904161 RepID=I7EGF2_9CUCU|nr:NADH dehydrogenase subunit 6 [Anaspis sp. BMNH 840206]